MIHDTRTEVLAMKPAPPPLVTEPGTYQDYLQHMFSVGFINFPTTLARGTTTAWVTDIWDHCLATAETYGMKKIDGFMYYSGSLKLRFVMQGMPMTCGQLVIWAYPEASYLQLSGTSNVYNPNLIKSKVVPHVTMDPSQTCVCEMTLPCPNPEGYWYQRDASTTSYRVGYTCYAPLNSGTSTLPTDIEIRVFAEFVDLQPGPIVLHSTGDPSYAGESLATQEEAGPISAHLDTVSQAASTMGSVPVIGPYATVFSGVSSTLASVLKWFGYNSVQEMRPTQVVTNRTVPLLSTVNSKAFEATLGTDEMNSVSLSSRFYGPGDMDEMDMTEICKIPGWMDYFSITYTAARGDSLLSFSVTPIATLDYISGVDSLREYTPLTHMIYPFRYWHGEITYTFDVVASPMHRATLMVCHSPIGVPANMEEAYQELKTETVVISGNTTFQFTVPWRQYTPALPITGANGAVYVYLVNGLTSNGGTNPVIVNVYMHSNNMKAFLPQLDNLDSITLKCDSATMPTEDKVSVADKDDFYLRFAGENLFQSTKKLSNKYSSYYTFGPGESSNLITTFNKYFVVGNHLKFPRTTPETANAFPRWTYLTWYAAGYYGTRGSVKFSWLPNSKAPPATFAYFPLLDFFAIANEDTANIPTSGSYQIHRYGVSRSGGFNVAYDPIHPSNEVILPHYDRYYFRIHHVSVTDPEYTVNAVLTLDPSGNATNEDDLGSGHLLLAAGEDFSFVKYLGLTTYLGAAP